MRQRDELNLEIDKYKKYYVEAITPMAQYHIGDIYQCIHTDDHSETDRMYEIIRIEIDDLCNILYLVKETNHNPDGEGVVVNTYKCTEFEFECKIKRGYVQIARGKKFPAHDGCHGVWMSDESLCNMCASCRFVDPDVKTTLDPTANPMKCDFIGMDIRKALFDKSEVDWESISYDKLKDTVKDMAAKFKS